MQVVGTVGPPPADGDRIGVHAHLGAQGRERLGDAAGLQGVGERGDQGRVLGQRPFLRAGVATMTGIRRSVSGRLRSISGTAWWNAARRAGSGLVPTGTAATAPVSRSRSCASPPKKTSRLSAKWRKKVRSVKPARAAMSPAVVLS